MGRDEVLAGLERRQVHWAAHDADALAAYHAVDGKLTSPIFGTIVGRPAIRDSYAQLFSIFGDWSLKVTQTLVDATRVAQLFTVHATHSAELFGVPATGRRFEIRGVLVFELDEQGLIANEQRLYDFTGMLLQVGILKIKPRD